MRAFFVGAAPEPDGSDGSHGGSGEDGDGCDGRTPVGLIIGLVVGGAVLVSLIPVLVVVARRRKRQQHANLLFEAFDNLLV